MPGTILDMHIHTTNGASDSQLAPDELAEGAARIGMTGVNVTEHDRVWDRYVLDAYRQKHAPFFVNAGMEVSTDLGHVLAVGLKEYVPGIRRADELRRALDAVGGFMIVAHPFRHWFDPVTFRRLGKEPPEMTAEKMAQLPIFSLVDAIEVLNGANTLRENRFALEVAEYLGKPGTGGSDAHSTSGIGYYTTVFEHDLQSSEEMLAELHARRFYPALGLAEGRLRRFTLGDLESEVPAR
ncbi:MAG: PHP domain-containing protein [Dehalococcoidia bacterium]